MAPPVNPTSVNFYAAKDFAGEKFEYKIDDDVALPGSLNDRFLSVNVGINAKVIAWQHYNESGRYREWEGENPDISDIGGLSRFKVVTGDTRAIAFKFRDATGGSPKKYSLKLVAHDVGVTTLYSNDPEDSDAYRLVGVMPEDGPPVTTALYCRDEEVGAYVWTGSVFFQWDKEANKVDIVENDNWPEGLEEEQTGPSTFVVTLAKLPEAA
ncbi:Beta/Gamma crystallin-domain-containing protein [Diplogelasinospora grovesii]|uniref:Beta/Gamma crystallin-domain-containing protein n=1 Tax=Diplogelasinospora grovesii TaxID=303347 RepID=A0AAN6N3G7_9PEZI|nr:Beta/Gamma crystallin-domain-containing protein [Diplogelasinospora grovesii]